MRNVQYTLNDEEFLLLRSVCVIKETNLKRFSREAVLEYIKKFLSDETKVSQINQLLGNANTNNLKEILQHG